jgi:hypothetical protein
MSEQPYVGIDLDLLRSVIVRMNAAGERLGGTRIANDPASSCRGPLPHLRSKCGRNERPRFERT